MSETQSQPQKEEPKKTQKTIDKKFRHLRGYMEGPKDRADVKLKKFQRAIILTLPFAPAPATKLGPYAPPPPGALPVAPDVV